MAETAGDREERLEQKLRKMEAEVADLRMLLAGRRERDEWSEWGGVWQPIVLGILMAVGTILLAKYT